MLTTMSKFVCWYIHQTSYLNKRASLKTCCQWFNVSNHRTYFRLSPEGSTNASASSGVVITSDFLLQANKHSLSWLRIATLIPILCELENSVAYTLITTDPSDGGVHRATDREDSHLEDEQVLGKCWREVCCPVVQTAGALLHGRSIVTINAH